jgi:hypothetical protein
MPIRLVQRAPHETKGPRMVGRVHAWAARARTRRSSLRDDLLIAVLVGLLGIAAWVVLSLDVVS